MLSRLNSPLTPTNRRSGAYYDQIKHWRKMRGSTRSQKQGLNLYYTFRLTIFKASSICSMTIYLQSILESVKRFVSYGRSITGHKCAKKHDSPSPHAKYAPWTNWHKPTNHFEPIPRWSRRCWKLVALDLMGPYSFLRNGKRYLLTVTNVFSRWLEAFPI